nr:hypothetical protein [Tanacetum cinerariifolium]
MAAVQTHAGVHLVGTALQAGEHGAGLGRVGGLVEHVAVEAHDGISGAPGSFRRLRADEFHTSGPGRGTTVEAKSHFGTEGVESYYRIGEQVTIMYSAKNPQVFTIEGYDVAGVFLLFLMAAFACGVLYWGFIRHGV